MTRLVEVLVGLPDTVIVTVGWIRAMVDAVPPVPTDAPDLDVAAFARLVGRSPAQVRQWCAAGELVGAYHLPGRKRAGAWRIPPAAVEAFRARGVGTSRHVALGAPISTPADAGAGPSREADVPRIGDWRQHRKPRKRGRRA